MEETAVTYHFDEIIDRRNTNSLKWDVEEKELPMWVADMDFQTAPEIREAIEKRAAHGVFGYSIIPEEWQPGVCGLVEIETPFYDGKGLADFLYRCDSGNLEYGSEADHSSGKSGSYDSGI